MEEPEWIQLSKEDDTDTFARELRGYIDQYGEPQIAVIILDYENSYPAYKNICYSMNVISQVVQSRVIKKNSLSVASNILRQINTKLGGDLYNLKFPKEVSPNTMLIGIDVCHHGKQSIVGFCATINQELSQYYSHKIL